MNVSSAAEAWGTFANGLFLPAFITQILHFILAVTSVLLDLVSLALASYFFLLWRNVLRCKEVLHKGILGSCVLRELHIYLIPWPGECAISLTIAQENNLAIAQLGLASTNQLGIISKKRLNLSVKWTSGSIQFQSFDCSMAKS